LQAEEKAREAEEARIKAEAEARMKSQEVDEVVKNSIAPTPRKAIPKGAVAKAKAALLETKKAEPVVVETDKQVCVYRRRGGGSLFW
jgi:hypothetical protein